MAEPGIKIDPVKPPSAFAPVAVDLPQAPATPPESASAPVIPVAQESAPPKVVQETPDYLNKKNDEANKFNAASDNLDINAFSQLTKSPDPLIAQAAKARMDVINKNSPLANHLVSIDPTSAQGKLEFVQTYKTLNNREEAQKKGWTTVADNPQIGNAMIQYLMGDKKGAVLSILGGNIKQSTEFDDQKKMLVVNTNELDEIDSVYDIAEKRMISREEYAARGGSRPLEKTLGRINDIENAKLYREKFAIDTENQNKSSAALAEAGNMSSQMQELAKNFKDLNPDQQQLLAGFTDATLGYKQSLNDLTSLLDQASKTHGEKLDAETGKAVAAALGKILGGLVTYGEDNTFKISGGESLSVTGMKQKLEQLSHTTNIEKAVNQKRADLARSMRLAAEKGDTDPETLKKYAALDQYFTLAKDREALYGSIKDKSPSFIALPTDLSKIEDQASRMRLSGLQGEYAAAQMQGYITFRNQMLKEEKSRNSNFIPEPGRYEAAWVKQKEYAQIRDDFRQKTRDILAETPNIGTNKPNAPSTQISEKEVQSTNKPKGAVVPSPSESVESKMVGPISGGNKPPEDQKQTEKFHYEYSPDGKKRRKVYD